MTRRASRELAFFILFEKSFSDASISEIIDNAGEARDVVSNNFAVSLAEGAVAHLEEIDNKISEFSHKWSKARLSRVALTLLRLALYEMFWEEEIPVSVSINEAVELAKLYGGEADATFINGVLGGISRGAEVEQ
ncbi:MAG: transcription antitermination factor NusB [Clostridia bacterium]|jgi:N utilization substance protein B|nr:transcription antitermination factor NusB [Clostridia bacterium]